MRELKKQTNNKHIEFEPKDFDIVPYLNAIPQHMKRGRAYLVKCPCGGTLKCIRSTYNDHLRASCECCKFSLIE